MNTTAKGTRAVREYAELLQDRGYTTDRKQQGRGGMNDYWGMFDICSFNGDHFRLTQVKSNSTQGAVKAIRLWLQCHDVPAGTVCEVAVRKDGAGGRPAEWRVTEVTVE